MKNIKTMLLGIALIVSGGCLKVLTLGYEYPKILDFVMNITFFLGIIIFVVGFCISDKNK